MFVWGIYFLDMAAMAAACNERAQFARKEFSRTIFCVDRFLSYVLQHDMNWFANKYIQLYVFFFLSFCSGEMTSDFFRVVNEARSHSLGPFSPSFNIQTCLLEGLQKFLPPDAHERVNGRLHVSLTRSYDGKNIIVSQFDSREDLLQALLCACFIPGFSGILPPRFQGIRYMDGAFSDNLPVLDENTVTVSPFCGESDICPRDQSAQLFHVS